MEKLILDIEERLRADVPELETVDENYAQLVKIFEEGRENDTYPVMSPAVLIDTQSVAWSNLAGSTQQGTVTVVVTLAIDCYDDTHATTEQRAKIAGRMRLASRVHWALQGWKPSETTKMIRTGTRMYHLPHLWKAYETTYTCVVLDMSKPEATTATTDGTLPLSVYD